VLINASTVTALVFVYQLLLMQVEEYFCDLYVFLMSPLDLIGLVAVVFTSE